VGGLPPGVTQAFAYALWAARLDREQLRSIEAFCRNDKATTVGRNRTRTRSLCSARRTTNDCTTPLSRVYASLAPHLVLRALPTPDRVPGLTRRECSLRDSRGGRHANIRFATTSNRHTLALRA
jgi:hypothetical protein